MVTEDMTPVFAASLKKDSGTERDQPRGRDAESAPDPMRLPTGRGYSGAILTGSVT